MPGLLINFQRRPCTHIRVLWVFRIFAKRHLLVSAFVGIKDYAGVGKLFGRSIRRILL